MALSDFDAGQWGTLSHKHIPITTSDEIVTLLDGVAGQRIKVVRLVLSGDTQVIYSLFSGAEPLFDFYGSVHFGADEQASDAGIPAFITNVNDSLKVIVSAAVTANIYLQYKYITS